MLPVLDGEGGGFDLAMRALIIHIVALDYSGIRWRVCCGAGRHLRSTYKSLHQLIPSGTAEVRVVPGPPSFERAAGPGAHSLSGEEIFFPTRRPCALSLWSRLDT